MNSTTFREGLAVIKDLDGSTKTRLSKLFFDLYDDYKEEKQKKVSTIVKVEYKEDPTLAEQLRAERKKSKELENKLQPLKAQIDYLKRVKEEETAKVETAREEEKQCYRRVGVIRGICSDNFEHYQDGNLTAKQAADSISKVFSSLVTDGEEAILQAAIHSPTLLPALWHLSKHLTASHPLRDLMNQIEGQVGSDFFENLTDEKMRQFRFMQA